MLQWPCWEGKGPKDSLISVQSSFKDVLCVNGGAVPLPPHGRQLQAEGDGPPTEEVGCLLNPQQQVQ